MNKEELRIKYKALRDNLSSDEIEDLSLHIANRALQLPIWNKSNYHLFLSITDKKEINTEYLLQILAGKDKNVILSKSNFKEGTLTNFLLTDNTTIKINSYGIPEPVDGIQVPEQQIDVVFIPLLAFDKQGNRIGYGKGFYDRFLEKCNPNILKIGVSFFEPEDYINDIQSNDVPLDFCITPNTTYTF
ncbi:MULTISPECIES: 5-formyltetrahydrofolate cyclo-ligase [Myroides]|uniref:5-formyltetrahydrofolate cyclo-ligase n=1 Tax=Myroides TaxID=76831 RepID=UPI001302FAFC|nr:5-formyltetrahydrofolate cyclo-ligase [Myroides phaeus]